MIGAYRRYPFAVPARVKFFNIFRYFFRLGWAERFLALRTERPNSGFWKRMVPPLYFYRQGSVRVVTRDGIKYRLDLSKQLDHSIYFSLVRDVAWQNLFQIIRPEFTIIDVGANIGYLTLQFAKRSFGGAVYAFEPDSETFSKLTHNVALNAFARIEVFQTALGAASGKAQLYKLYESNPGANRILQSEPGHALRAETVDITTLDSHESRWRQVDLIKIDVEGYELFVLQGSQRVISRFHPVLFIELVDVNLEQQGCNARQIIDWVTERDYLIFDARTMQPLPESDRYYTDIICFHKSSMEAYA